MADDLIEERVPSKPVPDSERVKSRAASLRKDQKKMRGVDQEALDHEGEAEELLAESEARTTADPAPRDLKEGRVERRTSDEATPPPPSR